MQMYGLYNVCLMNYTKEVDAGWFRNRHPCCTAEDKKWLGLLINGNAFHLAP